MNHSTISHKIKRLAYEIYEHNHKEQKITVLGINNKGFQLAKLIAKDLKSISNIDIQLGNLKLNPAQPLESVELESPIKELQKKTVIIVDDVANTGRTLFYACNPFFSIIPEKIQFAVLIDRKHKTFPVHVDYVGLSLATTIKDNIVVEFGKECKAYFN